MFANLIVTEVWFVILLELTFQRGEYVGEFYYSYVRAMFVISYIVEYEISEE